MLTCSNCTSSIETKKNNDFNTIFRSTPVNITKFTITTATMHIQVNSQESKLSQLDDKLPTGVFPHVNMNLLSLQNALENHAARK